MQSGRGKKKEAKSNTGNLRWEDLLSKHPTSEKSTQILSFSIPLKGHYAQKQVSTLHSITNTPVETLLTFSNRPNHHGVCQRERRQLRSSASKKRKRKKRGDGVIQVSASLSSPNCSGDTEADEMCVSCCCGGQRRISQSLQVFGREIRTKENESTLPSQSSN